MAILFEGRSWTDMVEICGAALDLCTERSYEEVESARAEVAPSIGTNVEAHAVPQEYTRFRPVCEYFYLRALFGSDQIGAVHWVYE